MLCLRSVSIGATQSCSCYSTPDLQGMTSCHRQTTLSCTGKSLIILGACYQQKDTNHAPLRTASTENNRSRSISYSHIHLRSTSTHLESLVLVRIWTFTSSKRISGLRSESLDKASRQHHKLDDPSVSPYNRMSETGTCQQLQWKGLCQQVGVCPPRKILT